MTRLRFVVVVSAVACAGCSAYDALFCVLGSHYTDGGTSPLERQRHYEQRVEAWENHKPSP